MANETQTYSVECVYYGLRDDMIAEVSAFDPILTYVSKRECKYLVMPLGDTQFDTEWFASRKDAREHTLYVAAQYPGAKVCAI